MRRSEMVDFILQKFPEWNDNIRLDKYDISAILRIIEEGGMLPPKSPNYNKWVDGESPNFWDEEEDDGL